VRVHAAARARAKQLCTSDHFWPHIHTPTGICFHGVSVSRSCTRKHERSVSLHVCVRVCVCGPLSITPYNLSRDTETLVN